MTFFQFYKERSLLSVGFDTNRHVEHEIQKDYKYFPFGCKGLSNSAERIVFLACGVTRGSEHSHITAQWKIPSHSMCFPSSEVISPA